MMIASTTRSIAGSRLFSLRRALMRGNAGPGFNGTFSNSIW